MPYPSLFGSPATASFSSDRLKTYLSTLRFSGYLSRSISSLVYKDVVILFKFMGSIQARIRPRLIIFSPDLLKRDPAYKIGEPQTEPKYPFVSQPGHHIKKRIRSFSKILPGREPFNIFDMHLNLILRIIMRIPCHTGTRIPGDLNFRSNRSVT